MPQTHEWMFYETMWRVWSRGVPFPTPWWMQQYFRKWSDNFDSGLFDSKEAAFCSNAAYRYWNMIGVKEHHQESLIGQVAEIEPVYDKYSLTFFIFDEDNKRLYFPQHASSGLSRPSLEQKLEENYLPVVKTTYRSPINVDVNSTIFATVAGSDNKSVVVAEYTTTFSSVNPPANIWFCLGIMPAGPSGFQRHDKAGRYLQDRRINNLYLYPNRKFMYVNSGNGPVFNKAADSFGLYGNGFSNDPDHYINANPFQDLSEKGTLNQSDVAEDPIAGLCCGVFAWKTNFSETTDKFILEVKLPVDDYKDQSELTDLNGSSGTALKTNNVAFWKNKLNNSGIQFNLPAEVAHLKDLFRICRSNLLILADHGQIHPGPTIYDDFWIRDSSIEGIAAALIGDHNLALKQFGTHYPNKFNQHHERIGPVSSYGFFGGEHEKNDREWDSNGQALWAIGRFDRINNTSNGFGSNMYYPYMLLGARWLRDNRSEYGLLHSGWSAEHIGDKNKPHYWDDFWAMAGIYEAAKVAERINAAEKNELWDIYNSFRGATIDSIRWVLTEQANRGHWETFIPTGPGDVGRLDSTMVGILTYFHPCRLYMGNKLASDIDYAARMSLETIWNHFMDNGGFRHDSAWNCYGPYLTLQLAHAFLLLGDLEKMDACLNWSVGNAAYAKVDRRNSPENWNVVLGAWNEQHCYPISKNFSEFPSWSWYMGDMPHGWACAEYLTLMRDIFFFEADEDANPHIYIAPGILKHWVKNNEEIKVDNAPTVFGTKFGYKLVHDEISKRVTITITQHPNTSIEYLYPCPFGSKIVSVSLDGNLKTLNTSNKTVSIPKATNIAVINYS